MGTVRHEQPNLVVVVLDTARGLDTVPADPAQLPTMASLAEAGSAYSRAFASAPWTLPSHASLMTGTYSSRHGTHGDNPHLDGSLTTLPEIFSEQGYETRAISNNTWFSDEFGFDRGFETFHNAWSPAAGDERDVQFDDGGETDEWRKRADYADAEATTELTIDWLGSMGDRPFFVVLNYIDAHFKYAPPPEYLVDPLPAGYDYDEAVDLLDETWDYNVGETTLTKEECSSLRALYRGELAYLDANVGRFVEELKRAGQWEDTILVVTGDHGENIGDHGFIGHQYNLYDTLLHVPLVLAGGAFNHGTDTDRLVQHPDLAPTLLDAAGIDAPQGRAQFQGQSFHPESSTPEREFIIGEHIAPRPPLETLERRYDELPPHLVAIDHSLPLRAIRTDEYKLVVGSDGARELYHTETDPMETVDLSERRQPVADQLADKLDRWLGSFDRQLTQATTTMSPECEERLRDLGYL